MSKAVLEEEISRALKVLKLGGIILYPTDTIWGLGCDPDNIEAVNKIYNIKKRSDTKAMIILVNSSEMIFNYINKIPELAYDLIELTEKPLTIIYDGARNLAPNLISSDGSIGIRVSKEKFSNSLIKSYRKPIVSTSANISDKITPRVFSEIDSAIIDAVDYVVDWEQEKRTPSAPSGIIRLGTNGEVKIIRK